MGVDLTKTGQTAETAVGEASSNTAQVGWGVGGGGGVAPDRKAT